MGTELVDIHLEEDWTWNTSHKDFEEPLKEGKNSRMATYSNKNYSNTVDALVIIYVSTDNNVSSLAEFIKAVNKGLTTINVVESFLIEINFEISYATNIIISSGKTLTLVHGATLKIVDGVTFTGEGEFVNNGTIVQA